MSSVRTRRMSGSIINNDNNNHPSTRQNTHITRASAGRQCTFPAGARQVHENVDAARPYTPSGTYANTRRHNADTHASSRRDGGRGAEGEAQAGRGACRGGQQPPARHPRRPRLQSAGARRRRRRGGRPQRIRLEYQNADVPGAPRISRAAVAVREPPRPPSAG